MKIVDDILHRFGYARQPATAIRRRSFDGANIGRLYSSWTTTNLSADGELRQGLSQIRARSRELERNNDYAKKFLRMVKTNVVGQNGIIMQSKVTDPDGRADDKAREKIEAAWKRWCAKGVCEVTGKFSFRDVQKQVIASIARDGEVLVRKIKSPDNPFGFALQLLEPDHLDDMYNVNNFNGNLIKMGVELNPWGKPVAYHIYPNHPGDLVFGIHSQYSERIAIHHSEMMHIYMPYRISQTRGLPWMHSALTRLHMLGKYEEAELVASRLAAAKGGFYTRDNAAVEYTGDGTDEDDVPIQNVEPGVYEILPPGMDFKPFDPQHPTTAFKDFEKVILRGISSGLDVSYNYLANDLEGVNYSSIRAGVIDERDVWRDIQAFMAEHFLTPVFNDWLDMALLVGEVDLPFTKKDKFRAVKWQPRGWQWVDPMKDVAAKKESVAAGLDTLADCAAEQGKDLEEVLKQRQHEEELLIKYGLKKVGQDEQN